VGGGWVSGTVARMEGLESSPVGEGSRRCTGAP
jgi:hypothetical protein